MIKKDFNIKLVKQSEEYSNTHDMLNEALAGQIYLKETFHKVNTNQVTGEALKKVSVGGKGGFGSQGDARDQEKQVDVSARVMVMSNPSQEAFNHNVALKKTVVGWDEDGKAIYLNEGESVTQQRYAPSHLFGDKEIKGWIEVTKSLGREYNDYAYSNQQDPSDCMRLIEQLYATQSFVGSTTITEEMLTKTRLRYDELCGYKDAWKYVGMNGSEHRRYRFTVVNLLNQKEYKPKAEAYKPRRGYMNWEASSYNHNNDVYAIYRDYYYNKHSEEWLEDKMLSLDRKDCAQFMIWQLGEAEPWDSTKERLYVKPTIEPSEEFLKMKDLSERMERERRLKAAESTLKACDDWNQVYNWELTKKGKIKSFEK